MAKYGTPRHTLLILYDFLNILTTLDRAVLFDLLKNLIKNLFHFTLHYSGSGYIVGSEAASIGKDWRWSLRATPILGLIALLLIIFVVLDPPRGGCESKTPTTIESLSVTPLVSSSSYAKDILYLLKK